MPTPHRDRQCEQTQLYEKIARGSRESRRPFFEMSWDRSDHYRWVTVLATTGMTIGVLLALLGLPSLDIHGPLHHLGIMSPTCGATRALRLVFLGQLSQSLAYNPLGLVLVVGATASLARHLYGVLSGRWLNVHISRGRTAILLAVGLVLLLEINQQAHAPLLMTTGN